MKGEGRREMEDVRGGGNEEDKRWYLVPSKISK